MIQQLQEIFGSRSKAIEILYLMKELKPVVRQMFYPHELEKVRHFCERNKLFIELSPYKVLLEGEEKFSNRGKIVDAGDKNGMFLVYISKSNFNALWACLYETKQDHYNAGLMLGYPECCVKFFVEEFAKGNHNPVHQPLNPWTNMMLREEDIVLLSHFPCSSKCEKSVVMGKKRLALIEKYDHELAEGFYKRLNAPVILS